MRLLDLFSLPSRSPAVFGKPQKWRRGPAILLGLFVGAGLLTACASDPDAPIPERPPEELYNDALGKLKEERFAEASKLFDEVERQHPYSLYATRSQILSAYGQYLALDYDAAIAALDRFIALHPGNESIAYAFYLRALSYYERIPDVRRDQSLTEEARDALQDVIRRFPDTAYARDASLKLSLTEDHLAGREMEVGRFYLKQRVFTAAIGRFRAVITDYQTTSHVPEALHRLVESYLALGLKREAQRTAAVLGYNFPGSEWYQDSWKLLDAAGLTVPLPDKTASLPPATDGPVVSAAPRAEVESTPTGESFSPERGTALPPPALPSPALPPTDLPDASSTPEAAKQPTAAAETAPASSSPASPSADLPASSAEDAPPSILRVPRP